VLTFFKENYDEILLAHYTWKVSEKGFKISMVMVKNCCKINVRTVLICALYSIKLGNLTYFPSSLAVGNKSIDTRLSPPNGLSLDSTKLGGVKISGTHFWQLSICGIEIFYRFW
jgi:hypothetical protein